jgi:hypothetical protein
MYLSNFLNNLFKIKILNSTVKLTLMCSYDQMFVQSGPIAAIRVGNCKMLLNAFAVSDGPYAAKSGMEWIFSSVDLVFLALWACSVNVLRLS